VSWIKCLLGFHKWTSNQKELVFKCERCGKTKVIPVLTLLQFVQCLLDVQKKTNEIATLLLLGKTEEAKAKLEEWKKETIE